MEAVLPRLGSRIRERREAKRWSQRELGRRTGIHPARLSKLEAGARAPKLDELLRLREAFEAGLDEIVLGEGGPAAGQVEHLAREMEALGTPADLSLLAHLFEIFVAGYRALAQGREASRAEGRGGRC